VSILLSHVFLEFI